MLHILLLILKIIGIVLLCIIGALLLGIACALFVPVRYRIEAVRREGEGEPPVAVRVKVTWLLHLINFLFRFDGSIFVRARIMIFTVFQMPKKERRRKKAGNGKDGKKKRKRKKQDKQDRQDQQNQQDQEEEPAPQNDGAESGRQAVMPAEPEPESVGRTEDAGTRQAQALPDDEDREASEEAQEKPDLWDILYVIWEIVRRFFEKIRGFFENIQYTINKFCDRISSVSETIEYYRKVVEGEPFRRSFALCKKELIAIGKSLKPRKLEASLIVGMDDPASTGEILAVCGMLYPLIGAHVDVRGDFERERLEGEILIVGKLCMFTFLRTAVKIYFNKDIRKLYRLLKRRQ